MNIRELAVELFNTWGAAEGFAGVCPLQQSRDRIPLIHTHTYTEGERERERERERQREEDS